MTFVVISATSSLAPHLR